jgi:hypothetical protein
MGYLEPAKYFQYNYRFGADIAVTSGVQGRPNKCLLQTNNKNDCVAAVRFSFNFEGIFNRYIY